MIELELTGFENVDSIVPIPVDFTEAGELGRDTMVRFVCSGCKGMGGGLGITLDGFKAGEEGGEVAGGEGGGDLGGDGGFVGVNHGGSGGGLGGGLIFGSNSLVGDSNHLQLIRIGLPLSLSTLSLEVADMMGSALEPRTLCEERSGLGGIQGLAVSGRDSLLEGTDVIVLLIRAENDFVMDTLVD